VVLTREGHVWSWGQPWPPGDMYGLAESTASLFNHLLLSGWFILNEAH